MPSRMFCGTALAMPLLGILMLALSVQAVEVLGAICISFDEAPPDVAVTNVVPYKTVVGEGFSMSLNVTVENQGNEIEALNITIYANTTIVASSENVTLAGGNSAIFTFTWDTILFAKGDYSISATTSPVLGEIDVADNVFIGGTVRVGIPGDFNGDKYVGIDDLFSIAQHFGLESGFSDWDPIYDLIEDRYVGIDEVLVVASYYGMEIVPTDLLGALSRMRRLYGNPILARGSLGTWESHQVNDPVIIETSTEYVMYYSGHSDGLWIGQIGRATAPKTSPFQWTKDPRNPILRAAESYDKCGIRIGSVVKLPNGTLLMYYSGKGDFGGQTYKVCLAASNDGVIWTKHPVNPLISPTGDETSIEDPAVICENGKFYMIYAFRTPNATLSFFRGATSNDGVNWTKQSETVLQRGSPGEWDDCFIEWHSICKYKDQYYLIYDGYGGGFGGPNDGTYHRWSIGVAVSSAPLDGYVKHGGNPILEASLRSGEFDRFHVATPALYIFSNVAFLYYQGAYNKQTPYSEANWDIGVAYCPIG